MAKQAVPGSTHQENKTRAPASTQRSTETAVAQESQWRAFNTVSSTNHAAAATKASSATVAAEGPTTTVQKAAPAAATQAVTTAAAADLPPTAPGSKLRQTTKASSTPMAVEGPATAVQKAAPAAATQAAATAVTTELPPTAPGSKMRPITPATIPAYPYVSLWQVSAIQQISQQMLDLEQEVASIAEDLRKFMAASLEKDSVKPPTPNSAKPPASNASGGAVYGDVRRLRARDRGQLSRGVTSGSGIHGDTRTRDGCPAPHHCTQARAHHFGGT